MILANFIKYLNLKLISLVLILSFSSSFISYYPLLVSGPKAVFSNFEPQVAYIANSFSYMYSGKISYSAHPGTPTIILHALAIAPLRIYTKFIEKVPFYTWAINNIQSLFYYLIIVQLLVYTLAVSIFLFSIYNITKKYLVVVFSWFGLLAYSYMPFLGIVIQSETLSLLIISIWLLIFTKFIQKRSFLNYIILCALSGLAVANKLPNIFFIFSSILQVFAFTKFTVKSKIKNLLLGLFVSITVFVIGTWPIRGQYKGLFTWIVQLATSSGVHGGGEKTIFSLARYWQSIEIFWIQEKIPFLLVIGTLLAFVLSIRKNNIKERTPLMILLITISLGVAVFLKYPLVHYQLLQYTALLFVASYLLSRIFNPILIIIIGILAISSLNTATRYLKFNLEQMDRSINLENFIIKNPPKKGTVWEFGMTEDYTLMHIRDWSGIPFANFLEQERPTLFNLTTDMSKVITGYGKYEDLFNVCWDQLYIQGTEIKKFTAKYPNKIFNFVQVPYSTRDMYILYSDHCTKT